MKTKNSKLLLSIIAIGQLCSFSSNAAAQICPQDPRCINNSAGAGNQYRQDGLMNPRSKYGSKYSDFSWTSPYANNAPKLYDQYGNYRGRLSSNRFDPESISNPTGIYGNASSFVSAKNTANRGVLTVVPQNEILSVPGSSLPSASFQPYSAPSGNYIRAKDGAAILAIAGVIALGYFLKKIVSISTANESLPQYDSFGFASKAEAINALLNGTSDVDRNSASEYLKKLSSNGDAEAKYSLALQFNNGLGVPKDAGVAFRYFKESADLGFAAAQLTVGDAFAIGEAVQQDFVQAFKYYQLAAAQGLADAKAIVGAYYYEGIATQKNHTIAKRLLEESSRDGSIWGNHYLGILLYNNEPKTQSDYARVIEVFRFAAERGHTHAMHNLAVLLREEGNPIKNKIEAFNWFKNASSAGEHGFAGSQNNLGDMYEAGDGPVKSFGDAVYWYTRAAMQGEPFAYWSLGTMFANGIGVKKNDEESIFWLKLASNHLPDGAPKKEATKLLREVSMRTDVELNELSLTRALKFSPLKQEKFLLETPR